MTAHPSHLLITAPGTWRAETPSEAPASPDEVAVSGREGFVLDQALIELTGATALAPAPLGLGWEVGPSGSLIHLASSTAAGQISWLRCFTIPFWRRALPDVTPVLMISPLADAERALVEVHHVRPEHARQLWAAAVLAALHDLAGGPATIIRTATGAGTLDIDAAVAASEAAPAAPAAPTGRDLSSPQSVDTLVAELVGTHEAVPVVVDRLAVLEATVALGRWRTRDDLVVSNYQIFWRTDNDEFAEERSAGVEVALGDSAQVLTTLLPAERIDAIRVDPVATPCVLAVDEVRVFVGDEVVATIPGGSRLLTVAAATGIIPHPADPDLLVCVSNDPNFIFAVSVRPTQGDEVKVAISLSARPITHPDAAELFAELARNRDIGDGEGGAGRGAPPRAQPRSPSPAGAARRAPRDDEAVATDRDHAEHTGFEGAEIPELSEWETHGFITGTDGWCLPSHYDPMYLSPPLDGPPRSALELRMAVAGGSTVTTQLFVARCDGLFEECSSIRILLATDGQPHTYRIELPETVGCFNRRDIRRLRLDPVDQVVPFSVERLGTPLDAAQELGGKPGVTPLRLSDETRLTVVSVSHSDYHAAVGGVEKRLGEEQAASESRGMSYLHLSPVVNTATLGEYEEFEVHVRFDNASLGNHEIKDVVALVERIPVAAVLLHHAMGWTRPSLTGLLRSTAAPVFYHTHDYFAICPQYTLLRNNRQYCGAPAQDSASCRICTAGKARKAVTPRLRTLLTDLGDRLTIVCPSMTAARLHEQALPELANVIQVVPHEEIASCVRPAPRATPKHLRLAHIGTAQANKGWHTWRRLCEDSNVANRYELFHLGLGGGHTIDQYVPVSFLIDGPSAMREALEANRIDIALVWSESPETYSFTTVEAITAGCLVITSSTSGNAAELVRRHDAGVVADSEADLLSMLYNEGRLRQLVEARRSQGWTSTARFTILDALVFNRSTAP